MAQDQLGVHQASGAAIVPTANPAPSSLSSLLLLRARPALRHHTRERTLRLLQRPLLFLGSAHHPITPGWDLRHSCIRRPAISYSKREEPLQRRGSGGREQKSKPNEPAPMSFAEIGSEFLTQTSQMVMRRPKRPACRRGLFSASHLELPDLAANLTYRSARQCEREHLWWKYLAPGGTKPPLSYSRHRDVKTKEGSCRRTRDAPSNPRTAGRNEVPTDACGRVTGHIRRRCFNSSPGTAGGAHAPFECRWQQPLRRGIRSWGKYNKNAEPY